MNKNNFIKSLAEVEGIYQQDVKKFVDLVFTHIHRCILDGDEVRIDGVGKLQLKFIASKDIVNNFTGKEIYVPARVKIKFKTFPTMEEELQRLVK